MFNVAIFPAGGRKVPIISRKMPGISVTFSEYYAKNSFFAIYFLRTANLSDYIFLVLRCLSVRTVQMNMQIVETWLVDGYSQQQQQQQVTTVTAKLMNSVLGNVLKLIRNNIGAPHAPWMNRIASELYQS